MSFLNAIFGDPNKKVLKSLEPLVERINSLAPRFRSMSDDELKAMTEQFKERVGVRGRSLSEKEYEEAEKKLEEILPEAFAVIREAANRVLGGGRMITDPFTGKEVPFMAHFDVQLIGGIALHRGQISEMKTGEGKTLVATLPLYLNALTGRGVHLVTVNDYLSKVGGGWNGPLNHFLGLTTGVIVHDTAYIYDPDYRDESQYDDRLKSLKPISRKEAYGCDILYGTNNEFGFDYLRDNMVLSTEQMVQRELNYAIVDEVDSILIDEARTPLIISAPAEESTDRYYKFADMVRKLAEDSDYNVDEKMRAVTLTEAGIAKMEKMLGIENIYTSGGISEVHHIEQALKAHVLFKNDRDYVVKEGEVIIVDEFTGRLMHGRRYSEGLHQAIEAKEGVKIQRESQTLATITFQNYFRLYNKLAGMTGTAVTEAEEFSKIYNLETVVIPTNRPMVRKDSNDLIYKTEEAKFKAVVEEVKARSKAGQPVLVGTISIQKNEILGEMLEREGIEPNILNAKNHEREAYIIAQAGKPGSVTIATNMAGRGVDIILGGTDPSKEDQDNVKAAGGLHVIGTERHESRRIDNQLRGRAGRQGDPGSSQFFVSLEDDLMRIFGGDRMKSIMNTLKVPDDMPIENSLVSRSIESAQKKVEGNNFDIRKHLVEYDDVINKHREGIYRRRREILKLAEAVMSNKLSVISNDNKDLSADTKLKEGLESDTVNISENRTEVSNEKTHEGNPSKIKTLSDIVLGMVEAEIEQVVSFHTAAEDMREWNIDEIYQVASTIFPVENKLKDELVKISEGEGKLDNVKARTKLIEHLSSLAVSYYEKLKTESLRLGLAWPEMEKQVLLRSIDAMWVEHLEAMDYMRKGIGLRGYGQRDPLVEYKKEAYRMYNELNNLIQKQVSYTIFKVADVGQFAAPSLAERARVYSAPAKEMKNGNDRNDHFDAVPQKMKNDEGEKIGRNDPCPCGSGKKYKKCHGK